MKDVVVFGSRGFLGRNLKKKLHCKSYDEDLTHSVDCKKRYDFVILCAVDRKNDSCSIVNNAKIILNTIDYCKRNNSTLIHFDSICFNKNKTDYIAGKKLQLKLLSDSNIEYKVIEVGSIVEDDRNIIQKILKGDCDKIYADVEIKFSRLSDVIDEVANIVREVNK